MKISTHQFILLLSFQLDIYEKNYSPICQTKGQFLLYVKAFLLQEPPLHQKINLWHFESCNLSLQEIFQPGIERLLSFDKNH